MVKGFVMDANEERMIFLAEDGLYGRSKEQRNALRYIREEQGYAVKTSNGIVKTKNGMPYIETIFD